MPLTEVIPVDHIVKATKELSEAMDGYFPKSPPYEMQAIENLQSMMTGENTRRDEEEHKEKLYVLVAPIEP